MTDFSALEKQYNITRQELQDYYNTHNNAESAKYLNLSKTQLCRVLAKFEIPRKVVAKSRVSVKDRIATLDTKQFVEDYAKMTQKELAKKYDLTIKQVIYLKEKLGIEDRKPWQTVNDYNIDLKELEKFYKSHTLAATVEHFNIGSISTLKQILKQNNIEIERRLDSSVEILKNKISKEDLEAYYSVHTIKETCDYFGSKTVSQLIKYYNLKKSKDHETFNSVLARIDKAAFEKDFNTLNIYELFIKYDIKYTMYRKLVRYYNLGYKSGIFAFQNASLSLCEDNLFEYLKTICKFEILRNDRKILNGRELDFYIPEYKIGIEFNGTYWHSDLKKDKNYHFNKSKLAETKGVRLIHIWEYEWQDPIQCEKIKLLLNIALCNVGTKIYARNCEIKKISNKEAKVLNEKIHLQGHRNAQVTYGLFYHNELVQLMSFSKTKYNKNLKNTDEWEIIRGCPGSNNIVIGGVSRLFKHFVTDYKPKKVFSYCDFNKFDGKSYLALGMKFIGYTGPDLKYVLDDGAVVNRSPINYQYNKDHCKFKLYGAGSKGSKKYEIIFGD